MSLVRNVVLVISFLSVCFKLKQQDCILQCHRGVMRSPSWRHHPAYDALRLNISFKPVLCICI
jgi:hypothetical protein